MKQFLLPMALLASLILPYGCNNNRQEQEEREVKDTSTYEAEAPKHEVREFGGNGGNR